MPRPLLEVLCSVAELSSALAGHCFSFAVQLGLRGWQAGPGFHGLRQLSDKLSSVLFPLVALAS